MKLLLDQLIDRARVAGLRKTKALEAILTCLVECDRPMTLNEFTQCGHLSQKCDKATVFRLLQKLTDKGMVRRLGLHERAAYFTLLTPGTHHDYLICRDCGNIEPITSPCPVHQLEQKIREETGYTNLYHELEFFGQCPSCTGTDHPSKARD